VIGAEGGNSNPHDLAEDVLDPNGIAGHQVGGRGGERHEAPIPVIAGSQLLLFPCPPALDTLTRVVVPVCRSCTNTSSLPLVSPATRVDAVEENATRRPSALMAGVQLRPFPCPPRLDMLTRDVVPVCRSCTNTSKFPLVSPATRLEAAD
jgi:hypothetical protein